LVRHLTLDFSSGHDLRVVSWSPALALEPAVQEFSPTPSAPPPQKKIKKIIKLKLKSVP